MTTLPEATVVVAILLACALLSPPVWETTARAWAGEVEYGGR